MNAELRAGLDAGRRRELEEEDAADAAAVAAGDGAVGPPLPGRQSGSRDWVASRGEDGGGQRSEPSGGRRSKPGDAEGSVAGEDDPRGTRYRLAGDEHVAAAMPGRLTGGAVRASGENAPGETARNAFDGDPGTKWLDFGGAQPGAEPWLEYRLRGRGAGGGGGGSPGPGAAGSGAGAPAGRGATPGMEPAGVVLSRYSLTSAGDAPERDPLAWVVQGWARDRGWETVDERSAVSFPGRTATLEFQVPARAPPSTRFRLRITELRDRARANSVQLARWDLMTG